MALLLPPLGGGQVRHAALNVARDRQRGAANLGERPARLDADVDVDAARARGLRPADQPHRRRAPRAWPAPPRGSVASRTPGTGSRSTRSSSGCSRSSARTGWGLRSMQPRLATHARPAASSMTISSAVRPDGKVSVAVRIHSGRFSGARFWKNGCPAAPSTNRLSAIGRPPAPRNAPSATAR